MRAALLLVAVFSLLACGRYGPPMRQLEPVAAPAPGQSQVGDATEEICEESAEDPQ